MTTMAGLHTVFITGFLLLMYAAFNPSLAWQHYCQCSTFSMQSDSSSELELQGRCMCPEYGIIPENIRENIAKLELDYSQRVILSSGNIQKFHQIRDLNISGMQYIESGGLQGLETLQTLVLSNYYMRVLESEVFTDLKLTKLVIEGTSLNKIHALDNGTFLGLNNLNRLDMKCNGITDISEEHFRGLENLGVIYLNENKITQIKADTFINAPLLTEIYLSDNRISEIHHHAFVGLTRLVKVVLDGNSIKGMPQPVPVPGSRVESNHARHVTILLDDNPLRCDCHLNWIASWLDAGQECHGRCLTPSTSAGFNLEHVYKDGLPQCQLNNTVRSVQPGKQLELTCSIIGASWVIPDGQTFKEHGDCQDQFCLTNRDSLVIWRTSPELSGNYTCLSPDSTRAFFYGVHVEESSARFTVSVIAGIVASGFLLLVITVVAAYKLRASVTPHPEPQPPAQPPQEQPPPGNPAHENPGPANPPEENEEGDQVLLLAGKKDGSSSDSMKKYNSIGIIYNKKDSFYHKENINIFCSNSA
ncbi:leucine-rich repeat-containing protein 4-like [Lytechinus variegatus]|uniref:leucine-rich repeat-containing protein 4-like n=1 Tax=Lytechinus variegatus TaxID=7654 RepID=UPI001BB26337|nr:leucine-rich repeat-containing protein 4-like [Lytechinus variegatus]